MSSHCRGDFCGFSFFEETTRWDTNLLAPAILRAGSHKVAVESCGIAGGARVLGRAQRKEGRRLAAHRLAVDYCRQALC